MDHQLIIKAQQGDKQSFALILNAYMPKVMNVVRHMVWDQALADDMAQEVMVKVWQNLPKFDPSKGAFATWLHRITRNVCIDHLRKRKETVILDEDYDHVDENTRHLEDQLLLKQQMRQALDQLGERQRLAIILNHYERYSHKDIAEILETSVQAVESLLARARRQLRERLADDYAPIKKEACDEHAR